MGLGNVTSGRVRVREMYVCYTNQIGATINNQLNCHLKSWIICEVFILILERQICFSKTEIDIVLALLQHFQCCIDYC